MIPIPLNHRDSRFLKAFAIILSWALMGANLAAAEARLNHTPITSAPVGEAISVSAQVVDTDELPLQGMIYYRVPGSPSFDYEEMTAEQFSVSGVIPGKNVVSEGLEYYLEVEFANQTLTYPENALESAPLSISTYSPSATAPNQVKGVKILSPDPGMLAQESMVVIAASFIPELQPEDFQSITITLDNQDLTSQAEISGVLLLLYAENLSPGRHVVCISQTKEGQKAPLATWSFAASGIAEVSQGSSEIHGELDAGYAHQDVSSIIQNITDAKVRLWGNRGKLNWLSQVYVTNQERGNLQSRNRFLVGFDYRGLSLRVGDTNPRFSEFSLWGVRNRGVLMSVESKYFNFAATVGELRQPIEGAGILDSTIAPGTYSRRLMAIRPGFVLGKNAVLSLNVTKVKDDENSITYGARPKDNATVGADLNIKSANRRFEFSTETALSLFNDDISPGSMSDAKDFENIMVINQNFQPLPNDSSILTEGIAVQDLAEKLVKELVSSSLAHRTTLKLNYFHNELSLGYKRIGPAYISLASPTVMTDVQGFSAFDRLRVYHNRVYLTVGWENYQNNVNGRNSTTVDRTILSASASYFSPPAYPNFGFGLRKTDRENDAVPTIVIDNRIRYSSASYHFHIDKEFKLNGFTHRAAVIWSSDASEDEITSSQNADQNGIILSLDSRQGRLLETHLALNTQSQSAFGDRRSVDYLNLSASVRYMLLTDLLWVTGGVANSSSSGEEVSSYIFSAGDDSTTTLKITHIDNNNLQLSTGVEFHLKEAHSVNLNAYYYAMSDDGSLEFYDGHTQLSSEEAAKDNFVMRLMYSYRF